MGGAVIGLHGFVGQAHHASVEQGIGLGLVGGQVQIGEEQQAFAEVFVFALQRFLHLHDHVGLGPDIGHGHHGSAGSLVVVIRNAAAETGADFDHDLVAMVLQSFDASGGDAYTMFVGLDFFGNADKHLDAS